MVARECPQRAMTWIIFLLAPGALSLSLTKAQVATYRRDGVVLVKGALTPREVQAARSSLDLTLDKNPQVFPAYRLVDFQGWRGSRALRHIAMDSAVPGLAAQALGLGQSGSLRVMKDATLVLNPGDSGCGWHVDDKIFWPVADVPIGSPLEGCNVWIALTPVRRSTGGGLAVAPGSFKAAWREETRSMIAGEAGGGVGPPRTCELARLDPEANARLEQLKTLHDMEPGDALIHARYCYHRGETFSVEHAPTRLAYSVRYEHADARVFDNNLEQAIARGKLRGGEPLSKAGAFYPQVWPRPKPLERLAVLFGRVKTDRRLMDVPESER